VLFRSKLTWSKNKLWPDIKFRSHGYIAITEIPDIKTHNAPDAALYLHGKLLENSNIVRGAHSLPLLVLRAILYNNTGRAIILPPAVQTALEELDAR